MALPQTEPRLIPRKAIFAKPDKEQVMLSATANGLVTGH
jgi:hypothetical protein